MEIGLFFGTFNPVHNGHLLIAKSVIDQLKLDQIWFVLSPLSPFKNNYELLDKNIRADLINIALSKEKKMLLCKEEFKMKMPNLLYGFRKSIICKNRLRHKPRTSRPQFGNVGNFCAAHPFFFDRTGRAAEVKE